MLEQASRAAGRVRAAAVPGVPKTVVELERVLEQLRDDADASARYVAQLSAEGWRRLFERRSVEPAVLARVLRALEAGTRSGQELVDVLAALAQGKAFSMAAAVMQADGRAAARALLARVGDGPAAARVVDAFRAAAK